MVSMSELQGRADSNWRKHMDLPENRWQRLGNLTLGHIFDYHYLYGDNYI